VLAPESPAYCFVMRRTTPTTGHNNRSLESASDVFKHLKQHRGDGCGFADTLLVGAFTMEFRRGEEGHGVTP